MSKRATIQDVADYLKVSKSAVSHALSGRRRVSPELSRRLNAAIAELGYKPNFAAKVLTTRSTGLIGVVVNELENPNTVTLLNELSRELGKSGYSITLCLCESREVQEGCKLISRISNGMVDAIINMLPQLTNEEVLAAAADTPVLTYRRHKHSPIIVDYGRGVMQALDYLTELGHRRIGLISVVKVCCGDADPRETAYREYMIRKGLLDPALIFPGAGDNASGYAGTASLFTLPEPPTAIFAGNDLTASGVFQWAHDHCRRLPEELSVIGFDNSPLAATLYPRLTSVDIFAPRIAVHTARVLLSMIGREQQEVPPAVIHPELVVRDSCSTPVMKNAVQTEP